MKRIALNIAATTLPIGFAAVAGAAPAAAQSAERTHRQAGDFYRQAGQAISENRMVDAVALLEQAVTLAPRDAGYRLLLADSYMKSGRFQSAETTYGDVVSLDPAQPRAGIGRALMQVVNGRQQDAVAQLETLNGVAAPADLGLAWALAGVPQRAVDVLEPAARSLGATPRVRQNLALAYAFGGDWERARTIASQDIAPNEIANRMSQWAALAHRAGSPEPVMAMLGVTPVQDAGQPVRIALALPGGERSSAIGFAEARPVAPVQVASATPVAAPVSATADANAEIIPMPTDAPTAQVPAEAPVSAPVRLASVEPVAVPVPVQAAAPEPVDIAAVAEDSDADDDSSDWGVDDSGSVALPAAEPAAEQVPVRVRYAAAAQELVRPDPVVMRVANRTVRAAAPAARRTASGMLPGKRAGGGEFVVQLGSFSSAANADRAWQSYQERFGLRAERPVTMTIDLQGRLYHRVAVSGFEKRADANRACNSVKARGGECFVRNAAGDSSIDWAARYGSENRG